MEQLYIKRIENGLRGLRLGTKTQENCQCGKYLNKLKPLNQGMYDELLEKYQKQLKKLESNKQNNY